MKEIAKTGYWNGETAHIHHVHCPELSKWICNFLEKNIEKHHKIIDLGCGKADYLRDLIDRGFNHVTGYEGDPPKHNKNKEIILAKQYRHGYNKISLELPCGGVEPYDRTPLDAIKRELLNDE